MMKCLLLDDVPKVGWGQVNGRRCPTDYSLPGCLASIICYINAYEKRTDTSPLHIKSNTLDRMNQRLMNVTGMCYATLWSNSYKSMVNKLHRINDFATIIDRCMVDSGRKYTYLSSDTSIAGWKEAIIESLHKGRPVLMEFVAGLPEFSIITGYDDNGDTLIGWAYYVECAKSTEPSGMFRAAIDWANPGAKIVIIGDKVDTSLSDKDVFAYAVETMERERSQDTSYKSGFDAGFVAIQKWYEAVADTSNSLYDGTHTGFLHWMALNAAEPRAYYASYAKELIEKYSDNLELKKCFEALLASSLTLSDNGRALMKLGGSISDVELRLQCRDQVSNYLVGNKNLVSNLKQIVDLL